MARYIPCVMCLGTVVEVCGIEMSSSCPDIGSPESRKIIDKQATAPECTQISPVQCSCHEKCVGTTEYCITPDSSLLLLCNSALQGDHEVTKVQKFSTCLVPLGSAGNPSAEGSASLFPGMLGHECCAIEVCETIQAQIFLSNAEELHVRKPEYGKSNQLAHFHRSRLTKELN